MNEQGPFHGIPLPKDWPQHIKLAVIHMQGLRSREQRSGYWKRMGPQRNNFRESIFIKELTVVRIEPIVLHGWRPQRGTASNSS